MGNTLRMQIIDPRNQLSETAFYLTGRHASLLDCRIEIASGAVLHDFTPAELIILNEIYGFHDVDVVQGRRYAKLRCQLLDVFLFSLVFPPLTEFLLQRKVNFCRLIQEQENWSP